jgi:hypothetical protein
VLGGKPLTRSWCCYEIALYNKQCACAEAPPLQSFIAPTRSIYFGWDHTETTEARDKEFIKDRISNSFPGGFEGFQHVMNQANATSVLTLTETSPYYSPAALDSLAQAAEFWFDRGQPTNDAAAKNLAP